VVFQVSVVPYQDAVLFHPEQSQGQAASENWASGSTNSPEASEESSAPFAQQGVLRYGVM
jgi:hypothetical protein